MQTPSNQGSSLNYEELGAEAAKLNHDAVHQAAAALKAPGAGAVGVPQVCDLYKKVKPFLALILRIPFIPAPIKTAIQAFMSGLDLLCP